MSRVYVSIGSNVERKENICFCVAQLKLHFTRLKLSVVYENEAVGFDGDPFYNLAVGFDTELALADLSKLLREIEDAAGRDRSQPRFSPRTLDIDILLYDDLVTERPVQLPRDEISRYAFVLKPLAEICPDLVHPTKLASFQQLWQEFSQSVKADEQQLTEVELDF